jgi:hypothetical protein
MPKHLSAITLAAVMLTSGLGVSTVIQSATAQDSKGPIADMLNAMDSFGARLAGLETSNQELNSLLEEAKAENEKLQSNVKVLNLQNAALQSQIDALQSELDTVYESDADLQWQIEESRAMLESELVQMEMRLAESNALQPHQIPGEDLQMLMAMMDSMLTQMTILEARIAALENGETWEGSSNNGGSGNDNNNPPVSQDNDSDGFTVSEGDCNDNNNDINPGQDEIANGIDDNCDGQIDEGTEAALEGISIEAIDDSGSLTDTLKYTASANYSDGSTVDITDEASWAGEGAASAGTDPGVFLCIGAGSGEISAEYEGFAETASYTCKLV